MKKFTTLFAGLLVTVIAIAKLPFQSKITITTVGNTQIKVVVDNDRLERFDNSYRANGGNLIITDLGIGQHTIKIYQARKGQQSSNGWGIGRRDRFENYRLVYTTTLYIRPLTHIDIVINRFGKILLDEQPINDWDYNDSDWDFDDNDRRRERDWENGRDHGRDKDPRIATAMSVEQYNQARQAIQRGSFDKEKLMIGYQVLKNNYITSAQAKELMMQFSFDNEKLNFAKAAYRKTIDKGSFFIVYDVFSFNSSKQELAEFIRNYGY
jgi:hypothetical protein